MRTQVTLLLLLCLTVLSPTKAHATWFDLLAGCGRAVLYTLLPQLSGGTGRYSERFLKMWQVTYGTPDHEFVPSPYLLTRENIDREALIHDLTSLLGATIVDNKYTPVLQIEPDWVVAFHFASGGDPEIQQHYDVYTIPQYPPPTTYHQQRFDQLMEQSGLAAKYFIPNPVYEEEKIVIAKRNDGTAPVRPPVLMKSDISRFKKQEDGVLFVPDRHTSIERIKTMKELVVLPEVEWIGIEAVESRYQDQLDLYTLNADDSDERRRGKAFLDDYFTLPHHLLGYWLSYRLAEEYSKNPYMELIDLARRHKKRVYAIDVQRVGDAMAEKPHEIRNYNWARSVPESGRGIVFGGMNHMLHDSNTNVQDFLAKRRRSDGFFMLEFPGEALEYSEVESRRMNFDRLREMFER